MVIEEYYDDSRLSQSKLKLLLGNNPNLFNTVVEPKLYFEEKKYFLIGDGVDCQLTRPIEEYTQKFHISNVQNKPSDSIKSILNQIYDEARSVTTSSSVRLINDPLYVDTILEVLNSHGYQNNWKEATRIAKIHENWEYWNDLRAGEGKTILSAEEDSLISQIVMSIKTNDVTRPYFEAGYDVEILYQVPIFFTIEGVECKGLLDMVRINHITKTIEPIDIKTLGDNTLNFPKALRQRRYDIQGAFYTEGLKQVYPGYTILPFKFIVESTINPGQPLVYTMDETLLIMGRSGREAFRLKGVSDDSLLEKYYGIIDPIEGYLQLIEKYKWYMENGFEINKKIVESEGEFTLSWNRVN